MSEVCGESREEGVAWHRRRYLRGEQGETDRVQGRDVAGGRTRAAHAAHLNTKPHNTLLIVRGTARVRAPTLNVAPRTIRPTSLLSAAVAYETN